MSKSRQVLLRIEVHMDEWLTSVSSTRGISKQDLIKSMIARCMIDSSSDSSDINGDSSGDSSDINGDSRDDISDLGDIRQDINAIRDDISDLDNIRQDISAIKDDISDLDDIRQDISAIKDELQHTISQLNLLVENSKPKRPGRPKKQSQLSDLAVFPLIPDSDSLLSVEVDKR